MADELGKATYRLVVDSKQLVAGIKSAKMNVAGLASSFGGAQTAVVGFAAVAASAVAGAVRAFADFEHNIAKIEGLVGVPKEQLEEWIPTVKELSAEFGKTADEMSEALFFITSAGLRGEEALDVLRVSAMAAAAGLGEVKDVADVVTSAANAYGAEIDQISSYVDILVAGVREGKIQADEFAVFIGKVIPFAAQLGISFDEIVALIASLSRTGTDAATATTQIRNAMSKLIKPSKEGRDVINQFAGGLENVRRVVDEHGFLNAMVWLRERLRQAKEAGAEGTEEWASYADGLAKIFPDVRGLSGLLDVLGENLETNLEIQKAVTESLGDVQKAYNAVADTTKQNTNELNAAFENLKITIGEDLSEDWNKNLVTPLTNFIKWFDENNDKIKNILTLGQDEAIPVERFFFYNPMAMAESEKGVKKLSNEVKGLAVASDETLAELKRLGQEAAQAAGKSAEAVAETVDDVVDGVDESADETEKIVVASLSKIKAEYKLYAISRLQAEKDASKAAQEVLQEEVNESRRQLRNQINQYRLYGNTRIQEQQDYQDRSKAAYKEYYSSLAAAAQMPTKEVPGVSELYTISQYRLYGNTRLQAQQDYQARSKAAYKEYYSSLAAAAQLPTTEVPGVSELYTINQYRLYGNTRLQAQQDYQARSFSAYKEYYGSLAAAAQLPVEEVPGVSELYTINQYRLYGKTRLQAQQSYQDRSKSAYIEYYTSLLAASQLPTAKMPGVSELYSINQYRLYGNTRLQAQQEYQERSKAAYVEYYTSLLASTKLPKEEVPGVSELYTINQYRLYGKTRLQAQQEYQERSKSAYIEYYMSLAAAAQLPEEEVPGVSEIYTINQYKLYGNTRLQAQQDYQQRSKAAYVEYYNSLIAAAQLPVEEVPGASELYTISQYQFIR